MIDYQSEFKNRLIFLLLFILIVPLFIISYLGEKFDSHAELTPALSIKNSTTFNLRGTIRDIKLSRDSKTAYVIAASRGIYIINTSKPLEPKLIAQFKYFNNSYDKARSLQLLEDRAVLFVRDAQAGVYSVDIANPSEPKLLVSYKSNMPIYKFYISEDTDTLYMSDADGIKIADIKNPDEIKIVAQYNKKRKYFDMVEVKDNIIYLVSSYGIDIVDISFVQEPKLVGQYLASGDAKRITLSKNKTKAFLSSGYSGVEILDIANKLNPKPLGIFKTTERVENTIVSKDTKTIYVVNYNNDIDIVDIKNPDDAKLLRKIHIKSIKKAKLWDMALSVDENKLFVANGVGGVKVIGLR